MSHAAARIIQVDFKSSQANRENNTIRRLIRKTDKVTRAERDVLMSLANLWFHHRAKGEMHPGCDKIAKSAKVSVPTVKRALKLFREKGVIKAVAYATGGRRSTRYTFSIVALREWIDPGFVKEAPGKLVKFPVAAPQHGEKKPYHSDIRYTNHGEKKAQSNGWEFERTPTRMIGGQFDG